MQQRNVRILLAIVVLAAVALWVDLPDNPGIHLQLGGLSLDRELKVRQGLDLQGGMQVLLEAVAPPGTLVDRSAMEGAKGIVETRINALGVSEPLIQMQGDRRIIVELPGIQDPESAIETFGHTGLLEFIDAGSTPLLPGTVVTTTLGGPYGAITETLPISPTVPISPTATLLPGPTEVISPTAMTEPTAATISITPTEKMAALEVVTTVVAIPTPLATSPSPITASATVTEALSLTITATVTTIETPVGTPTVTITATALVTTAEPITATATVTTTEPITAPVATPTPKIYRTVMTGKHLASAEVGFDEVGRPQINFTLTDEGAKIFEEFTKANIGRYLVILMDKEVISSPVIESAIGQSGRITGKFSLAEVQNLVIQLKYGALPIPLKVVDRRTVGPTLGQDSLNKSLLAGAIGLGIIVIFMIASYRLPGLLADVALFIYTAVVLALFKLIPVVLTLAGVAGFILSIGMAVDANILIFERMKEELRAGKTLGAAIEAGFGRAWTSIRDSNISTLITCAILWWFGDTFGASIIKGFALTLAIGVLVSMFTAITVSRTFLRLVSQFALVDTPARPLSAEKLARYIGLTHFQRPGLRSGGTGRP